MEKRKIMYIVITIVCIIAIILGVYYQIFADKIVTENMVSEPENIVEDNNADDPEDLLKEFNNLFNNTFNKQGYDTSNIKRFQSLENEDIVYKAYDIQKEEDGKYSIDIKLPAFNIDNQEIPASYNSKTQSIFANKVTSIVNDSNQYTIYNIDYVAYINDGILSVVIKSTLKEGNSPQRNIVLSYNYNIETGESVTLDEVLEKYNISKNEVNKKINTQIKEASKQAEKISEATGQNVYKRDLSNAMYLTENVSNFLVGKDGQIYIIYAYGNNSLTSEIDIIKVER